VVATDRPPGLKRDALSKMHALTVGVGVFVAGFGVMSCLSRWASYPRELPGLSSFLAATWGDGLLLPATAGMMVLARSHLAQVSAEAWITLAAVAFGSAVGTATQVWWLLDPNPRTNWTLPAAHVFNFPGWYHAAFLIVASGGFAGLAASVALRLSETDRIPRACRLELAVCAMTISAFAALLVNDNSAASGTAAGSATASALIGSGVAIGIVILWVQVRRRRHSGVASHTAPHEPI